MIELASRYHAAVWIACVCAVVLAGSHYPWGSLFELSVLGFSAVVVLALLINDEAP